MNAPTPFHRVFGLSWKDFFDGTDVEVQTEIDLSIKEQLLDVVLIRKGASPLPRQLPDGFDLAVFNLITFKSYQEALDEWALHELLGHYVNYRKQSSPSMRDLLPETHYRLIAVSARFPQQLAKKTTITRLGEGVYEVRVIERTIRVIVVSELPEEEQNAMLHMFSASEKLLSYCRKHYRPHSRETSSLLYNLLRVYEEDPSMSQAMKEFVRETIDEILASLPAEELRKRLSAEERLKGLPAEERLKGLPAEERLKGLSADEVVRALSPEVREALVRQIKTNGLSGQL
jgi:hypothetical protein